MARICRGYYQGRAEQELVAIDANLAKVRDAEKLLAEAANDAERAELRFDLALVYRRLHCTGKAIEQYDAIQTLDVRESRKVQARRFADKLR